MQRAWLADYGWEGVTAVNARLCEAKHALHKPTSDGHEDARALWQSKYETEMPFEEAVELCRKCHKIAPFCLFNGNTFSAIIRAALEDYTEMNGSERYILENISGHIVAGTATAEEEQQFRALLQKIKK